MGVFEKAIIEGDEVLKYIPQRPPIVMVDKFFGVQENMSASGLLVKEDNIFCEDGVLQECGIIEHIAQSAAMRIGYIHISKGEEVPIGFIGSINKLTIDSLPSVGDDLRTEVEVEMEVFDITLISAKVKLVDKVIAECQMKVATPGSTK
jgi:3-hydroxymyristoyl/3-hydroxydecanoyl-(acyl carrier protein) dehydratases